jgi:hypothetical protein
MSDHRSTRTRRERRKSFRVEWRSYATIYDVERHLERPCILSDFSDGGAKITGVRADKIPDEFRLRMPEGDRRGCRVVWRTENSLGVKFVDRVPSREGANRKRTVPELMYS